MYLKVVCSWCGKLIRIKENNDLSDDTSLISHSICPDCSRKVKKEAERSFSAETHSVRTSTKTKGEKS